MTSTAGDYVRVRREGTSRYLTEHGRQRWTSTASNSQRSVIDRQPLSKDENNGTRQGSGRKSVHMYKRQKIGGHSNIQAIAIRNMCRGTQTEITVRR